MIVEVHTYRYGQEVALQFHCSDYYLDTSGPVLKLDRCYGDDGSVAIQRVVTIVAGDDYVIMPCTNCDLHKDEAKDYMLGVLRD